MNLKSQLCVCVFFLPVCHLYILSSAIMSYNNVTTFIENCLFQSPLGQKAGGYIRQVTVYTNDTLGNNYYNGQFRQVTDIQ